MKCLLGAQHKGLMWHPQHHVKSQHGSACLSSRYWGGAGDTGGCLGLAGQLVSLNLPASVSARKPPSLMAQVPSPGPMWWRERTDNRRLFSELHMHLSALVYCATCVHAYVRACMCACMHTIHTNTHEHIK